MLDFKGIYLPLLLLFPIFCSAQFSVSLSPFNSNDYFVLKPTGIDLHTKVSFGPQLAVDVLINGKCRLEFGVSYRNEQFQPIIFDEGRKETSETAFQSHVGLYRYLVTSEQTTLSLGVIGSLTRIETNITTSDVFGPDVFSGRSDDHMSLKLPFRIEQKLIGGLSIRYQPSVGAVYSYRYNMTKFKFSFFDQASIVYSWDKNYSSDK